MLNYFIYINTNKMSLINDNERYYSANPNLLDKNGQSILNYLCIKKEKSKILNIIKKYGLECYVGSCKTHYNYNTLMLIINYELYEVLEIFMAYFSKTINFYHIAKNGLDIMDIAIINNNFIFAHQLLFKYEYKFKKIIKYSRDNYNTKDDIQSSLIKMHKEFTILDIICNLYYDKESEQIEDILIELINIYDTYPVFKTSFCYNVSLLYYACRHKYERLICKIIKKYNRKDIIAYETKMESINILIENNGVKLLKHILPIYDKSVYDQLLKKTCIENNVLFLCNIVDIIEEADSEGKYTKLTIDTIDEKNNSSIMLLIGLVNSWSRYNLYYKNILEILCRFNSMEYINCVIKYDNLKSNKNIDSSENIKNIKRRIRLNEECMFTDTLCTEDNLINIIDNNRIDIDIKKYIIKNCSFKNLNIIKILVFSLDKKYDFAISSLITRCKLIQKDVYIKTLKKIIDNDIYKSYERCVLMPYITWEICEYIYCKLKGKFHDNFGNMFVFEQIFNLFLNKNKKRIIDIDVFLNNACKYGFKIFNECLNNNKIYFTNKSILFILFENKIMFDDFEEMMIKLITNYNKLIDIDFIDNNKLFILEISKNNLAKLTNCILKTFNDCKLFYDNKSLLHLELDKQESINANYILNNRIKDCGLDIIYDGEIILYRLIKNNKIKNQYDVIIKTIFDNYLDICNIEYINKDDFTLLHYLLDNDMKEYVYKIISVIPEKCNINYIFKDKSILMKLVEKCKRDCVYNKIIDNIIDTTSSRNYISDDGNNIFKVILDSSYFRESKKIKLLKQTLSIYDGYVIHNSICKKLYDNKYFDILNKIYNDYKFNINYVFSLHINNINKNKERVMEYIKIFNDKIDFSQIINDKCIIEILLEYKIGITSFIKKGFLSGCSIDKIKNIVKICDLEDFKIIINCNSEYIIPDTIYELCINSMYYEKALFLLEIYGKDLKLNNTKYNFDKIDDKSYVFYIRLLDYDLNVDGWYRLLTDNIRKLKRSERRNLKEIEYNQGLLEKLDYIAKCGEYTSIIDIKSTLKSTTDELIKTKKEQVILEKTIEKQQMQINDLIKSTEKFKELIEILSGNQKGMGHFMESVAERNKTIHDALASKIDYISETISDKLLCDDSKTDEFLIEDCKDD